MNLISKTSPILHTAARKVKVKQGRETGRRLLNFIRALNRGHRSKKAIGIAAPQVGISECVCVLTFSAYHELILVNPEIIRHSDTLIDSTEKCLSLPGEEYTVKRWPWVDVECDNLPGEVLHFGPELMDEIWKDNLILQSCCAQHELDHLQGITIDVKSKM